MNSEFLDRFMNSAIVQVMIAREDFIPVETVEVLANRDDSNWIRRISEMKLFCDQATQRRWRASAPIREDKVYFDFEDMSDAAQFKSRYS